MTAPPPIAVPVQPSSTADPRRTIEVVADPDSIAAAHRALDAEGVTTPFQTRPWVAAWVSSKAGTGRPLIMVGRTAERLDFVLPFEVARRGPFRVARWMSGSHASYNFGLWRRDAVPAAHDLVASFDLVGRSAGIDAWALDNMPLTWKGLANPLATAFGWYPALDDGHWFRLSTSFDELIGRRNAGHKRKKLKSKERMLAAAGDYHISRALSDADIHTALTAFFTQKADALERMGVADPFARAEVRRFYEVLATGTATDPAMLEVTRLAAGGAIRAVLGSIVREGTSHQLFVSTARDDLSRASPGETLFYRHIEAACAAGLAGYDMGLGAERYKSSWCDEVVPLVSSVHPVGTKGRLVAALIANSDRIKASIRRDERLWARVRALRALLIGRAPGEA